MLNPKLCVLMFVAACGGLDTVQSVDEIPPALRAKAPDAVWNAMVLQQPRSFIIALAPTATDKAIWRTHKARLLGAVPSSERTVDRDWEHLPLVQVRAASS